VHIALLYVLNTSTSCSYYIGVRRWRKDARWKRVTNSCFGSDRSLLYLAAQTMRLGCS